MSLARYLASLLNSSGQVPDAKLVALTASKLTGQVPDANAPSGSVIQVVSANQTTPTSVASGATAATPLQATITPISTTSKIVIFSCFQWYVAGGSSDATARIYKNGSSIASNEKIFEKIISN